MTPLLSIHPDVTARFPTYQGLVLIAHDLTNGPSDEASTALLREAEAAARRTFADQTLKDHPHLAAWREAYRAFGMKPQRTLNSAEALISRVLKGGELPSINRLADAYNAVSVRFVVPCGGEDLDRVVPPVRLKFADGTEAFDTVKDGAPVTDHPVPGEVVWADTEGVTCRAWNWRQGVRTRLTDTTRQAYFLFDALAPMSRDELGAAGDALEGLLRDLSPGCRVGRLWLGAAAQ